MIRRDAVGEDGRPVWVLIEQVDHARVSGDLARHWGGDGFAPLDPHGVVLPAIYRHDDGWSGYDRQPDVDAKQGRPLQFTEMEIATANAIWAESIQRVADLGPLAQYMVAGHFVALRQDGDRSETPEATRFVQEYRPRCQQWLEQWRARDRRANTIERAEMALRHLQLFDALSLWFCCQERSRSCSFVSPEGNEFLFCPKDRGAVDVSPWPFGSDSLIIAVEGRQVPKVWYREKTELSETAAAAVRLEWTLRPASNWP